MLAQDLTNPLPFLLWHDHVVTGAPLISSGQVKHLHVFFLDQAQGTEEAPGILQAEIRCDMLLKDMVEIIHL